MKQVGWSKTPNFGCFFIWSIEYVEKTDFGQLVTSMSNETEKLLRYNCTVEAQS